MRCFIAAELSETVQAVLRDIEQEMKKTGADIRWVRPENIHLTLKFLGDIEGKNTGKIIEKIKGICGRYAQFTIRLSGMGVFPGEKSPRVVWVGIKGNDTLAGLQDGIDMAMEEMGFEREGRGFTAHLTLGRMRSSRGREHIVRAVRMYEGVNLGEMDITFISLMRSDLHPEGARYTSIARVPLGG